MTADDEAATWRAVFDQAQRALIDMAPAIASFWKALVSEGVPAGDATMIVNTWLAELIRSGKKPS